MAEFEFFVFMTFIGIPVFFGIVLICEKVIEKLL